MPKGRRDTLADIAPIPDRELTERMVGARTGRFTGSPISNAPKVSNAWERVAQDTHRLRVPGGWLYRYVTVGSYGSMEGNETGAALCFVPDASA